MEPSNTFWETHKKSTLLDEKSVLIIGHQTLWCLNETLCPDFILMTWFQCECSKGVELGVPNFLLYQLHHVVYVCSVYESPSSKLSWRLAGNSLYCMSASEAEYSVKVLGEELAYNKALKQFKMFIIDKPLDPTYKVSRIQALGPYL